MARRKSFNTDTALECALDLFWQHGYERASLSDLLEHMSIQRSSFYNTFGDKKQLFVQALAKYIERVNDDFIIATLVASEDGRSGIEQVFFGYVDHFASDPDCKGCLIVNTRVEFAPYDEDVAQMIETSATQVIAAFTEAVQRGQAAGVINADLNPTDIAHFLDNTLTGMRVMGRKTDQRPIFQKTAAIAIAVLD